MKKFYSISLLLLFVNIAWAQNKNLNFRGSVKFYNQSTFVDRSLYHLDSTFFEMQYRKTNTYFHPGFAFQLMNKRKNIHEFELSDLSFGGNVIANISLRYEYIVNMNKAKDRKWVPSLGFAANPYFAQQQYGQGLDLKYLSTVKYFGLKAFITPRITYYLDTKLYFDLNVPVCVFDMYHKSFKTDDPAVQQDQREIHNYNFGAVFPNMTQIRIGIGLKF